MNGNPLRGGIRALLRVVGVFGEVREPEPHRQATIQPVYTLVENILESWLPGSR